MAIFAKLLVLCSSIFSVIYGLIIIRKRKMPKYVNCIVIGLSAQLMSNAYYLALESDPTISVLFTVALFGDIALALFLIGANLVLIPKEKEEKNKHFSIFGLIGAIILASVYAFCIYFDHSIQGIITYSAYILFDAPLLYLCVSIIENKEENSFKDRLFLFNIVTLIILFASAFMTLPICIFLAFGESQLTVLTYFIASIIWSIACFAWVPILVRGFKTWEA